MELLTDKVFETENTIKLLDLFYKSFINRDKNNFSFRNFVKYDEFKIIIHKFIIEVLGLFLVHSKHSDDTYDVYIKDLPRNIDGLFSSNNNNLVINERLIKNIYDGNVEKFMSILHELNHFKVKYDVLDGIINLDICRIVKENLLRGEDRDPFNEIGSFKSLKGKKSYINDFYYIKNYKNYSEEVYVEICSKKDFILFMKKLLIFYHLDSENSIKVADELMEVYIKDDLVKYDNHVRDLTMSLSFNSNYLSFDEAFNVSIKYHPEWLKYPQISVEYYLDNDGYVKKKDILQLSEDMNKVDDLDTKKYIQYLIDNIENKEINQSNRRS